MSQETKLIDLDKALDGARILYRHCMSQNPPVEGWVREFNAKGDYVRISKTKRLSDAGTWHSCYTLRVESILDEARAPVFREPKQPTLPNIDNGASGTKPLFPEGDE